MSPAERRYWELAQRRARGLEPDIARAVLRAFAILRDSLSDSQLTALIESGDVARILNDVMSEQTMDRAFIPLRARLRDSLDRSFKYAVTDLPKGGKVNGVLAVQFDVLHPNVQTALRDLDTKVITNLKAEARETVRAVVQDGLQQGVNPRQIKTRLLDAVGLSPSQEKEVQNYRAKLERGESVTGYVRRDKRYDTAASPEKIDKAVEAYRKRRVSLNAETNARTASLDAMKAGQKLSWEQAAEQGIVERDKMTKTWRGVKDTRERPEHLAMEGETVPMDSPYSNGEDVPGSSTYNCRCISVFRQGA